jgi:hypothetical protein
MEMLAISSLNESSSHNKKVNPKIIETQTTSSRIDAWVMYTYSLKFPVYKQKYPKRLAKFFCVWRSPLGYSNGRVVEDVCCKSNSYIIWGCKLGLQ